jgi:hypothetical protein
MKGQAEKRFTFSQKLNIKVTAYFRCAIHIFVEIVGLEQKKGEKSKLLSCFFQVESLT